MVPTLTWGFVRWNASLAIIKDGLDCDCWSYCLGKWSFWRELNPRPHPYQGCALPLSYRSICRYFSSVLDKLSFLNTAKILRSIPSVLAESKVLPWVFGKSGATSYVFRLKCQLIITNFPIIIFLISLVLFSLLKNIPITAFRRNRNFYFNPVIFPENYLLGLSLILRFHKNRFFYSCIVERN